MSGKTVAVIFAILVLSLYGNSAFSQSNHENHHRGNKSPESIETKIAPNARNSMHEGMRYSKMQDMNVHCHSMLQLDATEFSAGVKSKLAITHSQQAHWQQYEDKLKEYYESITRRQSNRQGETAAQNLRARIELMERHVRILRAMEPALVKLYDILTPRQRKIADKTLRGMGCEM